MTGFSKPKTPHKLRGVLLSALVRHYIQHCRPRCQAELEWFKNQPSIENAVEYAALAVGKGGKRLSHQRRIKIEAIEQVRVKLFAATNSLKDCGDFDELFELTERLLKPVHGIGELYIYDVSLRIGAKLGVLPQQVYLHAGTRKGAKALGLNSKAEEIELHVLPPALGQLLPHEVEDFLCIYKTQFTDQNTGTD